MPTTSPDDESAQTNNTISGSVFGSAVQIGQVQGDFHVHHHPSSHQRTTSESSRWKPDPLFVGRKQVLKHLRSLLRLGEAGDTAPVVLHGMTGSGKTSVATQLGAEVPDSVTSVFVDASSRTSLLEELRRLAGASQQGALMDDSVMSAAGPVTPELPVSSDILLIFDGVSSTDTLRGIVPRSVGCRILITSTVRYLDHGYTHVELDDWTADESSEYLAMVLPDSPDGDRALLAAALHHHPLALTQAAHHCRVLAQSVGPFLARLAKEPTGALGLGEASGHRRTTIRSIEMNIELATTTEPAAGDILTLLAHLGAEPLLASFLEREFPLTYVRTYGARRARWHKRLKKFLGEHRLATWSKARAMNNALIRDRAFAALLQLSLIKATGDGYLIHPLVAMVARARAGNPLPWLQIGFGLFAERIGDVHTEVHDHRDADLCLGHLIELTSTAIRHGYHGTAVIESCVHLARRLAVLGGTEESRTAAQFARHVLAIFAGPNPPRTTVGVPQVRARLALALISFRNGDASEALAWCSECLAISAKAGDIFHYVTSIRFLGEIASVVGEHDLSRHVLDIVNRERRRPHRIDIRVSLANTCTRIFLSINEIAEAQACSDWVLDQLTSYRLPAAVHQSALQMAALLARTVDDSEAWLRHEVALLDIRRAEQSNGRRPDRWFVESLHSTADAAIRANRLQLAQELLDEAVETAESTFGAGSENYANVLAVRGRLRLHQQRYPAALRDLTYCADFFRAQPPPANHMISAVLIHLALVLSATGARARAIAAATEAYEFDLAHFGPDHPETLMDLDVLNRVKAPRHG
ncbi:tetratricopeptide repeat protein [Lentzea fradiae]|uniref:tetratricopeptide repeat protein n=1 Tax=Lentzea fradiae TaxID=200378 RepID=UPI00159FA8A7|nr:tetratricopeptide repeat protein [Lentzea fradiae]